MEDRTTLRRALVIGLAALAAALGLFTVLPASAASVTPVQVPGNPQCPEGTTELKVEPVESGIFTDGTLRVTLVVTGATFDWTSNIGVDVVIVKGGPNANVYTYDPPTESTGDTELSAPINPKTGEPFGLSHISFCYDVEQATTTSTSTTSTSTTSTSTTSTSTTSTSTTSSTVPDTTSSSVGG